MEQKDKWKRFRSIAMVLSEREVKGKTTIEHRYYISSHQPDAQAIGYYIRTHWSVESAPQVRKLVLPTKGVTAELNVCAEAA